MKNRKKVKTIKDHIFTTRLTKKRKKEIDEIVKRAIREYGEVFRKLGKE